MLRITTDEVQEPVRLRLEGQLTGAWVTELEQFYTSKKPEWVGKPLVVDLKHLTRADAAGRYLLALIQRDGVAIENASPLSAQVLLGPSNSYSKQ